MLPRTWRASPDPCLPHAPSPQAEGETAIGRVLIAPMIRILEIALFVAPFALFAAWRLWAPNTEIGARHLIALGAALAICFGLLAYFRMEEAEPPNAAYVPAHLRGTTIEPPAAKP